MMEQAARLPLIVFAGGGTGGSVTPLLAAREELARRGYSEFLFLGTRTGFERGLVEKAGIPFRAIPAGKFRRYFDIRTLAAPLFVKLGFFVSLFLFLRHRPAAVISAGSFVGVPVVWAAWLLRIPTIIHQQDIRPSLSNTLTTHCARRITVTFEPSLEVFPKKKTLWIGNPVRGDIFGGSMERAAFRFHLEAGVPTVLVLGGGTGALSLNKIVVAALPQLAPHCHIIHSTGKGKEVAPAVPTSRYHAVPFLTDDLADAYAAATIVISRAGIGAISELSFLKKPVILIPLPGTHQEENATWAEQSHAALVLRQEDLTPEKLGDITLSLIRDSARREELSAQIANMNKPDAARRFADTIESFLRHV